MSCFFHIISLFVLSIILCYLGKYLTDHDLPRPPKDHLLLAPCLAEPHLTDRRYNFSLEKKTLNTFLWEKKTLTLTLHLSSQKPQHPRMKKSGMRQEVQFTQTINHFSLNPNHRRLVENTWKKNQFYREGVKFTGNIVTKKNVRRYLISSCL